MLSFCYCTKLTG